MSFQVEHCQKPCLCYIYVDVVDVDVGDDKASLFDLSCFFDPKLYVLSFQIICFSVPIIAKFTT